MKFKINFKRMFIEMALYVILCAAFFVIGKKYLGMANIAVGLGYLTAVYAVTVIDVKIEKDKYKDYILYILVGLSILVWIPISVTENVPYDPAYSVAMVRHSFSEIITLCSYDVHSPLYYFIAALFYRLCGNNIFGLKICSLFFMMIFYGMILFPFKKAFGSKVTLYVILITSMFPTIVVHCTEPRMYSMAFVSFSALCLVSYYILREFKIKYAVMFLAISVFCVYIHTYTMLAAVFLYLILAVLIICKKSPDKKKLFIWFPINAVIVSVSYIPWLLVLVGQFADKQEMFAGDLQKPFDLVKEIGYENFSSIMNQQNWQLYLGLAIFVFLLAFAIIKKNKHIWNALLYFTVFALVSFVGVYLASTKTPCFMGRYVTCASGAIIIIMALGLSEIKNRKIALIIVLSLMFSGLVVYKNVAKLEYDREGIKAYHEFVENNIDENDTIMYSEIHTDLLSVFHPEVRSYIYGHSDAFNPFNNSETFTDYKQLEKETGDIYFICFADKSADYFFNCQSEKVLTFGYMFYNFNVYRIWDFEY